MEDVTCRVGVPLIITTALTLSSLSACSYTPDSVENRTQLPSCGEYEKRTELISADGLRKNRCILDAFARGRSAELVRTVHGIDGGPHVEYVRVLGDDRVEVFVDMTRDSEAGPEARWIRWLCRDLHETRGDLEWADCREMPLDEA